MAWRSSGKTNEELVLNLWKNGQIEDEKVRDVMLKVRCLLALFNLPPPLRNYIKKEVKLTRTKNTGR